MIKNRTLASAAFGTHIHPLVAAVMATKGTVVEFGMGDYSTPILHEICKAQDRMLVSMESHPEWWKNFYDLKSEGHLIFHIEDWNELFVIPCHNNGRYGVIFIDHAPAEQRIVDIEKFKDSCDIMVVHDTDKKLYYGYNKVIPMFKYTYEYERYSKTTMLLSNSIDVSKLF